MSWAIFETYLHFKMIHCFLKFRNNWASCFDFGFGLFPLNLAIPDLSTRDQRRKQWRSHPGEVEVPVSQNSTHLAQAPLPHQVSFTNTNSKVKLLRISVATTERYTPRARLSWVWDLHQSGVTNAWSLQKEPIRTLSALVWVDFCHLLTRGFWLIYHDPYLETKKPKLCIYNGNGTGKIYSFMINFDSLL